ncbi:hypothetical protein JCM5350_005541 [Sporobolomyces pararoseus]
MSFEMLPQEVIDQVVSSCAKYPPSEEEHRTLANLCRTSKSFYTFSQNLLYSCPLHDATPVSWDRPIKLVLSLEAEDNKLGRLVRSLEGLIDFTDQLDCYDDPPEPPSCLNRGIDYALAWQFAMIRSCPSLREVDLLPPIKTEVLQVVHALKSSVTTLTRIKMDGVDLEDFGRATLVLKDLHKLFQKLFFPNLKDLEIVGAAVETPPTETSPQMAHPLERLHLSLKMGNLEDVFSFFPTDPSNLVSLTLDFPQFHPTDLALLLSIVPTSLRRLSITRPLQDNFFATLKVYGRNPEFIPLPSELFSSFPRLVHLSLKGFQGPSPSLLRSLVDSSPRLRSIDFTDSFWIPSTPVDTNAEKPLDPSLCFEEEDVAVILKELNQLKEIRFGFLPSFHQSAYEGLRKTLAEEGVEMVWQKCLL